METKNLQPDLELVEKLLGGEKQKMTRNMFHLGTPQNHFVSRGVGITRKSKEQTKKAKKIAKSQRATNQARKNKKFRPTGSNKRK